MSRINFTNDDIKNMIDLYNQKVSSSQIAKQYNVSKGTILKVLHENGVPYRNDRFDKETEKQICDLYIQYQNQRIVAEIIGTTHESVSRVIKRNGIQSRNASDASKKYTLNENYFDIIDSSNKAYILGLLCADGCLSKSHSIILALQESDKHILETINQKMESNRPIHFKDMKHIKNTYQNQYYLSITNIHMWNTLVSLGITPNKSLTLKYPPIPLEFNKSFILGYIDGDGCIYKGYNKVGVLGTEEFISVLNQKIYDAIGICGAIYNTKSNNITKSLEICGGKKVPKFLEWLYEEEEMYLLRKKQIYIDRYINKSLLEIAS